MNKLKKTNNSFVTYVDTKISWQRFKWHYQSKRLSLRMWPQVTTRSLSVSPFSTHSHLSRWQIVRYSFSSMNTQFSQYSYFHKYSRIIPMVWWLYIAHNATLHNNCRQIIFANSNCKKYRYFYHNLYEKSLSYMYILCVWVLSFGAVFTTRSKGSEFNPPPEQTKPWSRKITYLESIGLQGL